MLAQAFGKLGLENALIIDLPFIADRFAGVISRDGRKAIAVGRARARFIFIA